MNRWRDPVRPPAEWKGRMASPEQTNRSAAPSPAGGDVLTAVIIEDQQEVREGLQILINGTPGYRCLGAYRSMEEALDRLSGAGDAPRVLLVDIGLPSMSGIEGIPLLQARFHEGTQCLLEPTPLHVEAETAHRPWHNSAFAKSGRHGALSVHP
jgi:DNA-binding LytR/AlgR family response regulator